MTDAKIDPTNDSKNTEDAIDVIEGEDVEEISIYDLLAQRSSRNFDGYEADKELSNVKIPGELAYFLDDLVEIAADEFNQKESEALADVMDLGIVGWYKNLDLKVRNRLGLLELHDPKDSEIASLRQELENAQKQIAAMDFTHKELKARVDELLDKQPSFDNTPSAVPSDNDRNTDFASNQSQDFNGYTPLTSHFATEEPRRGAKKRRTKRRRFHS